MITEISNICLPNPSGLSNISLINTDSVERLNLFNIDNQIRIDLRIKPDYLLGKKFQVNFKTSANNATYAHSSQATPSGPIHSSSLTLKAQFINRKVFEAIESELKVNSKHILYMVYRNGYSFLVGSLDNPIKVKEIIYDSVTPSIQINLSGQTPDPARLIFTQSVPHFFKTRSHAFENDFYNFE